MKRILNKLTSIIVLAVFVLVGCEKDQDEAANKFVGTYTYTLSTMHFYENGEMTISKISANKISISKLDEISITDDIPRMYTVNGDSILSDIDNEFRILLPDGYTWEIYAENSTGIISGKKLEINGIMTSEDVSTLTNERITLDFSFNASKK